MFAVYCVTIIALAGFMGRATESLAIVSGPRIGGLLNATFGNAVELIISIFALQAGLIEVVLASLTGSVLGNLLLVGGLSFFVGGLKYKRQSFNVYDARHNSALLIFSCCCGLCYSRDLFNEDGRWQDVSIKYRCFYYYDYHVPCCITI